MELYGTVSDQRQLDRIQTGSPGRQASGTASAGLSCLQ